MDELLAGSDDEHDLKRQDRKTFPLNDVSTALLQPSQTPSFGTHAIKAEARPIEYSKDNREQFRCPITGIYIRDRIVSKDMLRDKVEGRRVVSLDYVSAHATELTKLTQVWIVFGVVVEKSVPKETAKNDKYVQMKLMRLDGGLDESGMILLVFGDAYEQFWKLRLGSVIGLLSPVILPPSEKSNSCALKVDQSARLISIGLSYDLGTCKAMRRDGTPCSMPVNKHMLQYCRFHVSQIKKNLSVNRSMMKDVKQVPKNSNRANGVYHVNGAIVSTYTADIKQKASVHSAADEHVLNHLMSSKTIGGRYVQHIRNGGGEVLGSTAKSASPATKMAPITDLRAFISNAGKPKSVELSIDSDDDILIRSRVKALQHVHNKQIKYEKPNPNKPKPLPVTKEQIERRKAIMQEKKTLGQQSMQLVQTFDDCVRAEEDRDAGSKLRAKEFGVDLDSADVKKVLGADSSAVGLTEEELFAFRQTCDRQAQLEYIKTAESQRHSMTVDAFYCTACSTTRTILREQCKKDGHRVERRRVQKYFWQCGGCKCRAETLGSSRAPTFDCRKCRRNEWGLAGLGRAQTVLPEKVLARGIEHSKFL
jgi:minichromosome maintenance protein 10